MRTSPAPPPASRGDNASKKCKGATAGGPGGSQSPTAQEPSGGGTAAAASGTAAGTQGEVPTLGSPQAQAAAAQAWRQRVAKVEEQAQAESVDTTGAGLMLMSGEQLDAWCKENLEQI